LVSQSIGRLTVGRLAGRLAGWLVGGLSVGRLDGQSASVFTTSVAFMVVIPSRARAFVHPHPLGCINFQSPRSYGLKIEVCNFSSPTIR
jgi:hypothetical protein